MRKLAVGILAHVDAGKTTLSESLLYESGMIRKIGRVDNKNSFLDTEEMERARGITIFSKQALIECEETIITLLDTPGHVDFAAEMERTLWVMDYAILVISGADGVQGHTLTLWKLLERYHIPTFVFVNKMDLPDVDRKRVMNNIRKHFGDGCIDFNHFENEDYWEQIAVSDDELIEKYFDGEKITQNDVSQLIVNRKVFHCYFGSALKQEGIERFLSEMLKYMTTSQDKNAFGARIFKIARDPQGNRLTYMKVTSGELKVKDVLKGPDGVSEEKINQIRIYSGEKYTVEKIVSKGTVCAVTGLDNTYPGQGLGIEISSALPVLEPILTYTVELPEDVDAMWLLPLLKQLEEEQPELQILWREETKEIQMKLMGEVQIDVLKKYIFDRFGVEVNFGVGNIVYKETISNVTEGIGHFEPLRHYAEVHLLLEPGEPGSGMQFLLECSEDILDKNWQRLILTHLEEKEHLGVLTGSPITDIRISVVTGRAHTKHTEGGDFRQATYRAVRQGLMQAESVLLEPYYEFRLALPQEFVGRAMTDINQMYGEFEGPMIEGEQAVLMGTAPVSTMQGYQVTLHSYTKGRGNLFCTLKGYQVCHNSDVIVQQMNYDPEQDLLNPSSSVFCSHGAGFIVPWYQVPDYMHVESVLSEQKLLETDMDQLSELAERKAGLVDYSIDEEQIEEIINRASYANKSAKKHYYKRKTIRIDNSYRGKPEPRYKEKYLIVDGYNIVHAWEELKCLVEDNLEGARMKLLDILSNYQGFVDCEVIVVFDAYLVKGNLGEMVDYQNIHVVYTKEAETADAYIEKLTHKISRDYHVTVATSDGLIQLITRGQNCVVMSAKELQEEIARVNNRIREYLN